MLKGKRRRKIGAAICLSLALAGCEGNPDFDLAKLFSQSTPAAPAQASSPAPDVLPPEPAAVPPPSPQLARFRNLRAVDVEALVGSPDFRRVEPPGELWQYRTAICVVDLFFYGKGEERRVIRADGRGRDPGNANDQRCGDGSEVLRSRLRASSN
jgi:hypothetical protein